MSVVLTKEPAEACHWCGQQNSQRLQNCASCGTRLVEEAEPEPTAEPEEAGKSTLAAICLTLIFGPLGLIYVPAWGTILLMFGIGIPLILTHHGGLWLTIGGRVLSAAIAYGRIEQMRAKPNASRDARRMLDEAARLENIDRDQAIQAYEEINRLYPNTRASREAVRNIEILKRPIPAK